MSIMINKKFADILKTLRNTKGKLSSFAVEVNAFEPDYKEKMPSAIIYTKSGKSCDYDNCKPYNFSRKLRFICKKDGSKEIRWEEYQIGADNTLGVRSEKRIVVPANGIGCSLTETTYKRKPFQRPEPTTEYYTFNINNDKVEKFTKVKFPVVVVKDPVIVKDRNK